MIFLAEPSKFDNPIVAVAAVSTLGIAAVALVLIVICSGQAPETPGFSRGEEALVTSAAT